MKNFIQTVKDSNFIGPRSFLVFGLLVGFISGCLITRVKANHDETKLAMSQTCVPEKDMITMRINYANAKRALKHLPPFPMSSEVSDTGDETK